MTLKASNLLNSPVGRQLCLAYVESLVQQDSLENDPSFAARFLRSIRTAGTVVDLDAGTSSVFGWTSEGHLLDQESFLLELKEEAARAGLLGNSAAPVLANLLSRVELGVVDDLVVMQILSQAVESAHFWGQPMQGEESLLAHPELRPALTRIAQHILDSDATSWWYEPWDGREQWLVRPVAAAAANTLPSGTPRTLQEHESIALLVQHAFDTFEAEDQARRSRQADPEQQFGGVWWSFPPYRLEKTTSLIPGIGPVGVYCEEDSRGEDTKVAWRIEAAGNKIFEIRNAADWARLCAWYPQDVTATRLNMWEENTGRRGRWVVPDWLKMANDFDGVHLTAAAYVSLAGIVIPVPDLGTPGEWGSSITGWTPDWTFYFVPVTVQVASRQLWQLEEVESEAPLWEESTI